MFMIDCFDKGTNFKFLPCHLNLFKLENNNHIAHV